MYRNFLFISLITTSFFLASCGSEGENTSYIVGTWKVTSITDAGGNEVVGTEPALTNVLWIFDASGHYTQTNDEGTVTSAYQVNGNILTFSVNPATEFTIQQVSDHEMEIVSPDDPLYRKAFMTRQ